MKMSMQACRRVGFYSPTRSFMPKKPLNPTLLVLGVCCDYSCLQCAPLTTSVRFARSTSATPPREFALAEEMHAHVPSTFTSIQQISRQVPPELMEEISSPSCGGLRQLLSRYPDWYECKQIGQVHVVRRRDANVSNSNRHALQKKPAESFQASGKSRNSSKETTKNSISTPAMKLFEAAAMAELQQLFPTFLVPVKALWLTAPESAEAEMKAKVLNALRSNQHGLLTFYEHPCHRVTQAEKVRAATNWKEQTDIELNATVLENGYVHLSNGTLCSPLQRHLSCEDNVRTTAGHPDTQLQQQAVCARLAKYEIQPYEWYRVARVLPTASTEVVFDDELCEAAAALLPPGRDVWQVLLSAPQLFTVRYNEGCEMDSTQSAPTSTTNCIPTLASAQCNAHTPAALMSVTTTSTVVPRVFVRFNLHPRFIPAGVAFVREEELLRELEDLAVNREENRYGLNTRQRRRKRKLQRQLAYLRNPTPYFDDRVLAQHLFDLLPMRDGVHQSALLGALPSQAVAAFPQNITDLLKERTDLFRLSDARHGVLVQRADAPVEERQRTVDSVTGDEILQCIYSCYSTRRDPRCGTTISRNLPRLPRLIRDRLFSMEDVVQELLCMYPEKVVLLDDAASTAFNQQGDAQLSEQTKRELQNVRGRRDFLVPFRFVGEWEEKLMEKYAKQQEKELAKNAARHHAMHTRRPRHY